LSNQTSSKPSASSKIHHTIAINLIMGEKFTNNQNISHQFFGKKSFIYSPMSENVGGILL
jgi:hypothetical protein